MERAALTLPSRKRRASGPAETSLISRAVTWLILAAGVLVCVAVVALNQWKAVAPRCELEQVRSDAARHAAAARRLLAAGRIADADAQAREGLETVGDVYGAGDMLDDTGQHLSLAAAQDDPRRAVAIRLGVLDERLDLLQRLLGPTRCAVGA